MFVNVLEAFAATRELWGNGHTKGDWIHEQPNSNYLYFHRWILSIEEPQRNALSH